MALGTGMRLHPREIEIGSLRPRRIELRLHGEAAQVHRALGGGSIQVQYVENRGVVIVLAVLLPGSQQFGEDSGDLQRRLG